MIVIKTNNECINEKKYIFDFLFNDCLHIKYEIQIKNIKNIELYLNTKKITVNEVLFTEINNSWLKNLNLTKKNLDYIDLENIPFKIDYIHQMMPIIFGNDQIKCESNEVFIGLDIFGSIFYLLSGYEESQVDVRDKHNRFIAKNSFLSKNKILLRPIVNEYIELLNSIFVFVFPEYEKKTVKNYEKIISSDVDQPYNPDIRNLKGLVKGIVKSLIKKKCEDTPLNLILNYISYKFGVIYNDRDYNNFHWMLEKNSKHSNKLIFFFLVNKVRHKFDGFYSMNEKPIKMLINKLEKFGHRFGVHFSYDTYKNLKKLSEEFNISKNTLPNFSAIGRQHYLRWCSISTPRLLEKIGLKEDYTLGFSDHVGFRAGTCFRFKLYDLQSRRTLNLYETPLAAMDVSLFSEQYMNIQSKKEIIDLLDQIEKECKHYNGTFSVVWHNNQLNHKDHRMIFEHLIS